MKVFKRIARDEDGGLYIFALIFLLLIICVMLVSSEVMRVHDLKEHLEDEIYRASNLAIKTAMYDDYRIDSVSKFDEQVAIEFFYSYLTENLGLDAAYVKKDQQGKEAYKLEINQVEVNGTTVRMRVKATAYSNPTFHLWDLRWEIPIEIVSRNMRTD